METPSSLGIMRSTIMTSNLSPRAAISPASPSGAATQSCPASARPLIMASAASRSSSTISSRMPPPWPAGRSLALDLDRHEQRAPAAVDRQRNAGAARLAPLGHGGRDVGSAGHFTVARAHDYVATAKTLFA